MGLPEVKADIQLVREQLLAIPDDASFKVFKSQLTENILPLLTGVVEAVEKEVGDITEELDDQAEAIDALIDGTGDVLHPETAAKFLGLIVVGTQIAKELEQVLPKLDDMTKKRVRELIKTYRQGAIVVENEIKEITLDEDDEEPGEAGEAADPNDPDQEAEATADGDEQVAEEKK